MVKSIATEKRRVKINIWIFSLSKKKGLEG